MSTLSVTMAAGADGAPPGPQGRVPVPRPLQDICSGADFGVIDSLRQLPEDVQAALGAGHTGPGAIADRGERFNPIDTLVPGLPGRRLRQALMGTDCIVVRIEYGGIALRIEDRLFVRRGGDAGWSQAPVPPARR